MARNERFTFLCDSSERGAIASLAAQLKRSQSDAVRFVVIEAARRLSGLHAETASGAVLIPIAGKKGGKDADS